MHISLYELLDRCEDSYMHNHDLLIWSVADLFTVHHSRQRSTCHPNNWTLWFILIALYQKHPLKWQSSLLVQCMLWLTIALAHRWCIRNTKATWISRAIITSAAKASISIKDNHISDYHINTFLWSWISYRPIHHHHSLSRLYHTHRMIVLDSSKCLQKPWLSYNKPDLTDVMLKTYYRHMNMATSWLN